MEKANAILMKEINLNHVRRVLKMTGKATKPQLAALTGLSVVTVNSLVKELLELGELFEDDSVPSNGGRPASTYRFNYEFSLALVVQLNERQGGDIVHASVVNMREEVLLKEEHAVRLFDPTRFYDMIDGIVSRFPSVKAIGIGIPGQSVNGEIAVSSHEQLKGIRLIEEVQTRFGLPVILENDVNAAISGYCHREGVSESQCVLGIYFPIKYPPGMGIYLDGKVVQGKNGMAGEIKFLPMAVDWGKPLETEVFAGIASHVVQTVNAVLAPDRIVIYREGIEQETLLRAWESHLSAHPMPTAPELVLSRSFDEDFEAGMKWLTLKELEPDHRQSRRLR